MKITLIYAVVLFARILSAALFIRALLSWFVRDMYNPLGKIYMLFVRFTEPFVEPFRRLLSRFNTGMFDFSVLFAFVAIELIRNIVIRIILFF